MLQLKGIHKSYELGDQSVEALRGVDIVFRDSEFVSILGPSGCGKTTLLNIIGGLDRYTQGDLVINGVSTKEYSGADWDSYRNHSIGFVFQSYNLIPHQSVLSNVELALTLSGVSKAERRRRAKDVLKRVGLADQMKKRPNQLSGGQMQRVAIARALVNNPDILLADEPTGALDSATSVQIMELLREIAGDKLIIMVTHNPELAEKYSTRIINLLDGKVTGDTMPVETEAEKDAVAAKPPKKASMSITTALSLSLNNLMTKKARTFLTAFAGSIGIIGIALILSLSNGVQKYINDVQEDTLSAYPLTIQQENVDISSLVSAMTRDEGEEQEGEEQHDRDAVYANTMMLSLLNTMMNLEADVNNLKDFKTYIESEESGMAEFSSAITYSYGLDLYVYSGDTSDGAVQINPSTVFENMMPSAITGDGEGSGAAQSFGAYPSVFNTSSSMQIWQELLPQNDGTGLSDLLYEQYDVLYGEWPDSFDEVVLVVNSRNELNDVVLYSLGLKDRGEIPDLMASVMTGETVEIEDKSWDYEELVGLDLRLVLPTDFYQLDPTTGRWMDMRGNETYMKYIVDKGIPLHISGIVRPNEDAVSTAINGAIGYTTDLTDYYIDAINDTEIVKQLKADETFDVIDGLPFDDGSSAEKTDEQKAQAILGYLGTLAADARADIYTEIACVPSEDYLAQTLAQYMSQFPDRQSMEAVMSQTYAEQAGMDQAAINEYLASMSDKEITETMQGFAAAAITAQYAQQTAEALAYRSAQEKSAMLDGYLAGADSKALSGLYDEYMPAEFSENTYDEVCRMLGIVDKDSPTAINIYAATFEAKDSIADIIADYNTKVEDVDKISYTDYVAIIMSSVTTIIDAITYVLVAFVAISLIVSSIMIGIITYISVLERTKEIGILRSIGASKRDISRVFNAETIIVGFIAGIIGIGSTLLLCLPINAIVRALSGIQQLGAQLPLEGGIILVVISVVLTLIAGLLPSRIAANKDPVEALRTE